MVLNRQARSSKVTDNMTDTCISVLQWVIVCELRLNGVNDP